MELQQLKRDENTEKVVLSLSVTSATAATSSGPTGLKINPLKANPLKRPNVFKTATVGGGSSVNADRAVNDKKRPAPMSAAERLILEEQERKRRRMDRDNAV